MNILRNFAISASDINIPAINPSTFIGNLLNLVYFVAGVVAVIVIIIAGFTYTTSQGQAAAITRAKNMILYGVIGLVVVILAFVITQFVIGRF